MKHLYIGLGKGKTTAALGLSVRAVCAGKKVMWVSTLKDGTSSEVSWLIENTSFRLHKVSGFVFQMDSEEKEKNQDEIKYFLKKLTTQFNEFDLVVLDEFIDLIDVGFLSVNEVKYYIKEIDAEVVVTGHNEYPELLEIFDYYTEFKNHKHPFDKGVMARKGIEY